MLDSNVEEPLPVDDVGGVEVFSILLDFRCRIQSSSSVVQDRDTVLMAVSVFLKFSVSVVVCRR